MGKLRLAFSQIFSPNPDKLFKLNGKNVSRIRGDFAGGAVFFSFFLLKFSKSLAAFYVLYSSIGLAKEVRWAMHRYLAGSIICFISLITPMRRKTYIRGSQKDKRSHASLPIYCFNPDTPKGFLNLISSEIAKSIYLCSTLAHHMPATTLSATHQALDSLKIVAVHTKLC